MVICPLCALTGHLVPLHVETWFIRARRRHEVTRYWVCPICKLNGHRAVT